MWSNIFYGVADVFQVIFTWIVKANNTPNLLLMSIGFIAIILWIRRMAQYNREAEEKGGLK